MTKKNPTQYIIHNNKHFGIDTNSQTFQVDVLHCKVAKLNEKKNEEEDEIEMLSVDD